MCYRAEFGSSTSNGVNINRGNPKIGERWAPAPLGMGGVADPKKHAPSTHVLPTYLAERGRSAPKGVGINRR